jgi:glutamate carboxypeptidase
MNAPSLAAAREELLRWLPGELPASLEALRDLVALNSFTANPEGVDASGRLVVRQFGDLGLEPELVPSEHPGHGHHLFLSRPGASPEARTVLLVSHLDTVYPPEEERLQDFRWEPAPEEGRIYGPGTVDIKGGTVLLHLTLRALRHVAPDLFASRRWLVALNSSEEVLSRDFAARTAERCPHGAEAVLVFEGGPVADGAWQIVSRRKGRALFRLTAEGRGAHAGSAHREGVNAVVALAEAIREADALTDPAAELTVNVGTFHGGTVVNRVPHEAAAELEIRAYDPARLERAGAAVQALERPLDPARRQAGIRVECLGTCPAWPGEPGSRGLADRWIRAAGLLGIPLVAAPRGGLSDANYLSHLGPTLDGLGPAGGNAHCSERTADRTKLPEYVEPGSFVPKAALNALAMLDLLG